MDTRGVYYSRANREPLRVPQGPKNDVDLPKETEKKLKKDGTGRKGKKGERGRRKWRKNGVKRLFFGY